MITKIFQAKELARARELQKEAAALHIPVPVLSWRYEIKNKDGTTEEVGIGKSNSYTRNALNWILRTAGLCDVAWVTTSAFGDGFNSFKATDGTLYGISSLPARYSASTNPRVTVGTSTSAESLDDYALPTKSGLTAGTTSVSSTFNATTRKAITTMTNSFYNGTGSAVNITESGVDVRHASSSYTLMIHDIFDAISIDAGKTITWTYLTEVSFPNP